MSDLKNNNTYIHPSADVQTKNIGKGTTIWQFCVILKNAVIGSNCNINCHAFIENDVVLGNNVTVKVGAMISDGSRIGNNVFVGPNVIFTNDKYPRSKEYPSEFRGATVEDGATIGTGSIVVGNVRIGKKAMIGAGSIITKDIPENELWVGNPARFVRRIDQ